MSEGLTLSGLASALGVTRAEVAEAVHAGRITAGADGRYDLDQARAAWGHQRSQEKPPQQPVGDDPLGYASARARRELAAARIMEMREGRLRGEYLRTEDAVQVVSDIVSTFRGTLENLPHRLAPQLVGKALDEILAILKAEHRDALTYMSDQLQRQLDECAQPDESEFPSIRGG